MNLELGRASVCEIDVSLHHCWMLFFANNFGRWKLQSESGFVVFLFLSMFLL